MAHKKNKREINDLVELGATEIECKRPKLSFTRRVSYLWAFSSAGFAALFTFEKLEKSPVKIEPKEQPQQPLPVSTNREVQAPILPSTLVEGSPGISILTLF